MAPPTSPPPEPMPAPPAGPPPLPEKAPAESSQLVTERGPFGVCFVCGTPLEGRLCPTCRMSWVE